MLKNSETACECELASGFECVMKRSFTVYKRLFLERVRESGLEEEVGRMIVSHRQTYLHQLSQSVWLHPLSFCCRGKKGSGLFAFFLKPNFEKAITRR